jgi:predicted Holliday junction resolvase-like endonuclease
LLEAFLTILLIIAILCFIIAYLKLRSQYNSLRIEFDSRAADKANILFQEWRSRELQSAAAQIEESLRAEFNVEFERWLEDKEAEIRKDAISKSVSTILGRAGEHIAPLFLLERHGIDMRDLRFIGTPIDFIAFKGLSKGDPSEIAFIEVKSGKTIQLTSRERSVRELIEGRRVSWLTLHLGEETAKAREAVEREIASLTSPPQLPSPPAIICSNCGTRLQPDYIYCHICGKRVK